VAPLCVLPHNPSMTANPRCSETNPARRLAGLISGIIGGAIALTGHPSMLWAQPPPDCKFGQRVTYQANNYGLIVSGREGLCLVRSVDGTAYDWVPLAQLSIAVDPPLSAAPSANASRAALPAVSSPGGNGTATIIRPARTLVYHADRSGHVTLTAEINGTPVRFIVDTGATFVTLSRKDASAVGIKTGDLIFNLTSRTANGTVRAAPVRFGQI